MGSVVIYDSRHLEQVLFFSNQITLNWLNVPEKLPGGVVNGLTDDPFVRKRHLDYRVAVGRLAPYPHCFPVCSGR